MNACAAHAKTALRSGLQDQVNCGNKADNPSGFPLPQPESQTGTLSPRTGLASPFPKEVAMLKYGLTFTVAGIVLTSLCIAGIPALFSNPALAGMSVAFAAAKMVDTLA